MKVNQNKAVKITRIALYPLVPVKAKNTYTAIVIIAIKIFIYNTYHIFTIKI